MSRTVKIKLIILVLLTILFLTTYVVTAVGNNNYKVKWSYKNNSVIYHLAYLNNIREVLLTLKLRQNILEQDINYKISGLTPDDPRILVAKGRSGYKRKEKINIKLSKDNPVEKIRLKLNEDVAFRSGLYNFNLRPEGNTGNIPVIHVELFHPRLSRILTNRKNMRFNIGSGPGKYQIKKPVKVEVQCNYQGWALKVYGTSLRLDNVQQDEHKQIPLNRMYVALKGKKPVPLKKNGVLLTTVDSEYNKTFWVNFYINSTWDDAAGIYSNGKIEFEVKEN